MASLVAATETPKRANPQPEFRTPMSIPRKDESTPLSTPSSANSNRTAMNFVEILTEARSSRSLSDKYRLILSSVKYVHTGIKPTYVIPPVQLLNELSKMTSLLDGFNEMLVTELFKCKVLSLDIEVLEAYLRLLLELARSNTFHYDEVCRLLLSAMASIDDEIAPQQQLDLVHNVLQRMIKELPHFSDALLKQTSRCLPFMTKPWRQQVHMYRQMLRIVDYVPGQLSLDILSRLVHKIIDLDCHCPKEELLAAEESVEDGLTTQFVMDTAENDSQKNPDSKVDPVKESGAGDAGQPTVPAHDRQMKHELGNTFDRLMELFFEYIDAHVPTDQLDKARITYRRFLAVFDRYIMATYKCLHVQFLMFYICSKRPLFTDHLIDFLWHRVQDPNTSIVFRQMAVAYLGSLLSRAAFVSVGTLKDTLALLSRFLHNYIAQSSSAQSLTVDVNRHATFYAVCQSLLYCVAFRHKDIAESSNGLDYLRGLNLEQLITSPLNPLKVMSKPIATNFANVSRHYQVVYCHAIIERNQRSDLPMARDVLDIASAGQQSQYSTILESYFPFDPYVLVRSRRFIEPIYRQYVDYLSAGDAEDDDEEMDDAEEEIGGGDGPAMDRAGLEANTGVKINAKRPIAVQSAGDAPAAMSVTSTAGSVGAQTAEKLFGYSVSPGFVH